ncbi:hypothetical protein KUDE01_008437, partial [Dissostichus eleginoides]
MRKSHQADFAVRTVMELRKAPLRRTSRVRPQKQIRDNGERKRILDLSSERKAQDAEPVNIPTIPAII